MGLIEQNVSFKFAGGVETKMDSKAVPPVRLLGLENGVFSRAISIKKRNGYSLLSRAIDGDDTTLITDARRLASRDDELLLFTKTRCYSKESGYNQWSDAGALIAPLGYDRPALHTSTAQTMPDHAINGDVIAYAWEDSLGGVYWTTADANTGRIYRASVQAHASGERPRVVAVNEAIHIYYAVPSEQRIYVIVINPATPSDLVAPKVLIEDLDTTNPVYDAVQTTHEGTPAFIVWAEYLTTNIRFGYVSPGGVLGSPASGFPIIYRDTVALAAASPIGVAYLSGDVLEDATAGAAVIDLVGGDGGIFGGFAVVITARGVGTSYNGKSLQLIADGAGTGTFVDGAAAVFHYQDGVTTVADLVTAASAATYFTVAGSGVLTVPETLTMTGGVNAGDLADDEIAIVYQTGTDMKVSFYTADFPTFSFVPVSTQIVSPATTLKRVAIEYAHDGSHKAWCAGEENAFQPSMHRCVANWAKSTPEAGTAATIRSVGLASRAFQAGDDADVFAVFVHDTTYFNTYLTYRLSDFAQAGRHLPGSACGPTRTHVASVHVAADDVARLVLPYKSRLESAANDKFAESALRMITMDFDSEDSHQTAQFGRGLYLAAACPQHYDGRMWTEQGFNVGPEHITTVQAGGGSLTISSTYEYKAWYEWTDGQGEVHRGPESIGISAVTGGSDTQATLTLPTLRVTRKDNVRICVARSLPGDANRFWRVSSLDPTTAGAVNGYIANDKTIDTVTFIDRMSDVTLQLQEQVYTVGGILSNDPCPLGSHVAVGKNRLFFTDAEAGNVVRFSKRIATGFGAECAPELQQDIDPYGGGVTALGVMDDVVFVFKASCVFAFNGDGPYEDGGNTNGGLVAGFSASQIITSDVGCTDPASIVLTPQGLMFKSAKGIYIISRSREVSYIGAPVEAYNAQNVRRATVMPDRTAVLFLTDEGSSLYYDYLFQQWSTFTNHAGLDAAVVGNTYHYLRTNDIVFRETPDQYADGGARITLRFETAWLHLHEHLQGFQRFWKLLLLGTWTSPHQLAVQHRLNYDEAWSEPYYLDATGDSSSAGWITGDSANAIGEDPILGSDYGDGLFGDGVYGGTGPDVYQWRYGIHEDGQSVQFRFEDFEKAGLAGASFELTEMTIVGGIKKPDMRPFSAARST
jgi:hypothetical protein